jgi:hypothetical protein
MLLEYFDKKVPNVSLFMNDETDFESDMRDILNDVNYIIIKVNDGGDDSKDDMYDKIDDEYGFKKWKKKCESDCNNANIIETDDVIELLHNYIIRQKFTTKINNDYLNIFRGNDETYVDIDGLSKKLNGYYNLIFKRYPEDRNEWSKFLNFVQDSGIITPITKNKLIETYGENGDKTEIGNQAVETIQ